MISTEMDAELHQTCLQALLQVVQLMESFARSYLPTAIDTACDLMPEPIYLRWWSPGQLVSRAIGSRRVLRTGISLTNFELQLINQSSPRMARIQAHLPLSGQSPAMAAEWLQNVLADALPRGYSRSLLLPDWQAQVAEKPFETDGWPLTELTDLYEQAHQLLAELAESLDLRCTPVRFSALTGELSFAIKLCRFQPELGFSPGGNDPPCFFIRSQAQSAVYPILLYQPGREFRLPELKIRTFLHQQLTRLAD